MNYDIDIYRARMAVNREDIDMFLDAMSVLETPPGSYENVDTGEAWIEVFSPSESEINEIASVITDMAESIDGKIHAMEIIKVPKEDWTESWKQFFHVLHITDRITIRPIWEDYAPRPDEIVIDIEPGMSFGTGMHPTTQSCIRFLEKASAEGGVSRKVIDMGCGSGILAIAAKKMGFGEVCGYDNDPLAVRIASENAKSNGVDISFDVGDALTPELPVGDVVVANILAPILLKAAPAMCKSVSRKPNSILILSGILDAQYHEIRSAYEAEGFFESDSLLEKEWRSGMFIRRATQE